MYCVRASEDTAEVSARAKRSGGRSLGELARRIRARELVFQRMKTGQTGSGAIGESN
jgi:hypothetical protein